MSAPPATVEKRTKKPSAKVADPNNVANTRSGKKKGAAKGAKAGQNKPFVPISREQLVFIMAQVKAGHVLDPGTAGSQSQANTAATPGKKYKNTQQGPAVKKKAKQAVVSSDNKEQDEDEDVLDDILGAQVEICDSNSNDDINSNKEEDKDDENGAKVSSGKEGKEEEDVEPLNAMDEAAIANLSFEQLINAWEGLKNDIEEIEPEKGQSSSSGPVMPSTSSCATSKGNKCVNQTPAQSLVPVALPSQPGCLDRNGKPSHKINLTHFTPRTQRVDNLTCSEVRKNTALENAYPPLDSLEKYTWIQTLAELAMLQNRGDEEMMVTIERNFMDSELKELFTAYAVYRRSGFMNNLTTKARNAIGGHYGIPGSNNVKTIAKRVAWLTNQGTFGPLNIEKETCAQDKLYQNDIYRVLIRQIFFSRGKADAAVFKALTRTQSIPGPIFALLSMAVSHFSLCSANSQHLPDQTCPFTVEEWCGDKDRIWRWIKSTAWNALEAKAPTYAQNLSKRVFRTSTEQTNKVFLLEEAMDEMSGIDFEGLEAMAKWEEEFPGLQLQMHRTASASEANISPQTEGPAGPGEKAMGTPLMQGTDQTALLTPAPGAPANPVPAAADTAAAAAAAA
ncbi:hypothetical protein AAF712_009473 [Marasmius tenuissimus]|uniref:DUF6532 domain-containing protein n=1 Tax=Marasmius tenuissimus TaxID=585030 RepID=A0ABR2ZRA3_9AGAR